MQVPEALTESKHQQQNCFFGGVATARFITWLIGIQGYHTPLLKSYLLRERGRALYCMFGSAVCKDSLRFKPGNRKTNLKHEEYLGEAKYY